MKRCGPSAASLGLTDHSQVDMLALRHKSVNFAAEKGPGHDLTMIHLTISLTIRSAVMSDEDISEHFNISSRRALPERRLGSRGLDPESIQDNRRAMDTGSTEENVRAMLDKQAESPEGIEDGTHTVECEPFVHPSFWGVT